MIWCMMLLAATGPKLLPHMIAIATEDGETLVSANPKHSFPIVKLFFFHQSVFGVFPFPCSLNSMALPDLFLELFVSIAGY